MVGHLWGTIFESPSPVSADIGLQAMCNTFSTFGFVNAWGVFQAYYEITLLKDSSPSNM